jgi:hypothetical protein
MTSKPEPLSGDPAAQQQQAHQKLEEAAAAAAVLARAVTEQLVREGRESLARTPSLQELQEQLVASVIMVQGQLDQLKKEQLLEEEREHRDSDPVQELAELMHMHMEQPGENMARAAFRREDTVPAIEPSGSMIYTVQKGANTVPDLSFLRNAFTALTARFGTRGR